ncbi:unnamed protein product [Gadus morhua 'NCC']
MPSPVYTVLVQPALYWCSPRCTGAARAVLVQPALHWCRPRCTGAARAVLVQPALYWCSLLCTGAGCTLRQRAARHVTSVSATGTLSLSHAPRASCHSAAASGANRQSSRRSDNK